MMLWLVDSISDCVQSPDDLLDRDGFSRERAAEAVAWGEMWDQLATDPEVMDHSGDVTSSWELARRYGFTDADGRRPNWAKHWAKIMPSYRWLQESFRREARWLDTIARRAKRSAGKPAASRT